MHIYKTKIIGNDASNYKFIERMQEYPGAKTSSIIEINEFGKQYFRTIISFETAEDMLSFHLKYGDQFPSVFHNTRIGR